MAELVTQPDAPDGLPTAVARGISKGALAVGRQVPGVGVALAFVDDELAAAETQKLLSFISRHVTDDSERRLVTDPVHELTTAFVAGLRSLATEWKPVLLVFDSFDRTAAFLEEWILMVLDEHFAPIPGTTVVVIAGQRPLSPVRWSSHEPFIERIHLDVFTEDEAVAFLHDAGVADERLAAELIRISGRLPILLAMLAAQGPHASSDTPDVSADAIEVFLRWITDSTLRDLAIEGAVPRTLNEEILAVVVEGTQASARWTWLREQPFVQETVTGWRYHDVARTLLLKHKLKESPARWRALHLRVKRYHDQRMAEVTSNAEARWESDRWRTSAAESSYHELCAQPEKLAAVVLRCVRLSDFDVAFARSLAYAIRDAGESTGEASLARWGTHCADLLEGSPQVRIRALDALLAWDTPTLKDQAPYLLRRRALLLSGLSRYDDAILSLRQAIALQPDGARLHADVAVTYLRRGDWDSGIEAAGRAIETARSGDDRVISHALAVRASLHQARGQLASAMNDADRSVELASPTSYVSLRTRGKIHAARNEVDLAIADFQAGILRDPRFEHEGLQEIGTALAGAGRYPDAEVALRRSLELEPDCAHCWDALVRVATLGAKGAAPKLSDFGLDDRLSHNGFYWRAQALARAGHFEAAVSDFGAVYEAKPDGVDVESLQAYGLWLTYVDRISDAVAVCRDVLRRTPESSTA
ncbi:MAG: hypothetical protein QOH12_3099, partial [Solirubrobacteraceae bacterium]|nr:hypothetical protein [Solirubrobacteraceae bacterium]